MLYLLALRKNERNPIRRYPMHWPLAFLLFGGSTLIYPTPSDAHPTAGVPDLLVLSDAIRRTGPSDSFCLEGPP